MLTRAAGVVARARRLRGGDAGGGRGARRGGAPAVAAPQPAALPPRQGARAVRRVPPAPPAHLRRGEPPRLLRSRPPVPLTPTFYFIYFVS